MADCAYPLHDSYISVFYEQGIFQYTLETVVGFLVPYVIIVSSYVCILRRLRQAKFKRRIRSENLIQAIIVTFCIFWLPYHCINIVQVSRFISISLLLSFFQNFLSKMYKLTFVFWSGGSSSYIRWITQNAVSWFLSMVYRYFTKCQQNHIVTPFSVYPQTG